MLPTTGWLNVPFSRRTLLIAVPTVGLAAGLASPALAAPTAGRPEIHPREDWAKGLAPVGPLEVEEPDDVRFLLIHHSDTPNSDPQDRIPARLRSFYEYHTSAKGWPDVAYNFFIDRYGGLWEGRQGSIGAPVKGDATGGSQGFALLCCFIGDFAEATPTPEALDAATRLLAWLASSYRIDLATDHQVRFISRGSTRWAAGIEVVTDPIAGHRDMSQTTCPGSALYPLVRSHLLPGARALVDVPPSPTPTPSPAATLQPAPAVAEPAEGRPNWAVASAIGAGVLGTGALVYGLSSRLPR